MKIDCTKNCNSCEAGLQQESESIQNLLRCQLWDNDLKEACNSCQLRCKNNKNPELMISLKTSMELKVLLDGLKSSMVLYGVDSKTIETISKEYKKNKNEDTKNAIDAAKISNESIKLIQKGKHVDIAYLSIASSKLLKKIKKNN